MDRETRYLKTADLESIIDTITSKVFEKFSDTITETWIDKVTERVAEKVTEVINKTIEAKFVKIDDHLKNLDNTIAEHSDQIVELAALKAENSSLKTYLSDLNSRLVTLEQQTAFTTTVTESTELEELSERLEERTNRQLRQTLIFKNVHEPQYEKTWADTKQNLATNISQCVGVTQNFALQMLNRVHRGRPNPRKQQQRDIYANLYSWEICEKLVADFRKLNIEGKTDIRVEFKYGPRTTYRRNQALLRRKELKEMGDIMSGYVAYPARLMIKRPGRSKTDPYEEYEDFSKIKMPPKASRVASTNELEGTLEITSQD